MSLRQLICILFSSILFAQLRAEDLECNPLVSDHTCPPNRALSASWFESFSEPSPEFTIYSTPQKVSFTEEGLVLTIDSRYQNPGIKSNFYIMFGKVEAILKAAPGQGIVSSFYLQSDAQDEIDFEWFGGDPYEVQTNYFSKGNVSTYDRGGYHAVSEPQRLFYNYTMEWNEASLTWYVDSHPVRTLLNSSSEGYPQTPMKVFSGMWAGGDIENSAGTIAWAGGVTNYANMPYNMYISSLIVTDYSSASVYRYTDNSGDWTSIEAVQGAVNGRKQVAMQEFLDLVQSGKQDQFDKRNYSEELGSKEGADKHTSTALDSKQIEVSNTSTEFKSKKGMESYQRELESSASPGLKARAVFLVLYIFWMHFIT